MNPRVKSVVVLDDCILDLKFENGEYGQFSMKPYLEYPVYKPLSDYNVFKQAQVTMGFVSWNSGRIDMSPDNLYLDCKIAGRK